MITKDWRLSLRKATFAALLLLPIILTGNVYAQIFGIRYTNIRGFVLPGVEQGESKGRFGIYGGLREKGNDIILGIDYDSHKEERGDTSFYARRMALSIGYRYRLFPADKISAMKINPFVSIHYYKSFGKVKADSSFMPEADRAYYKDLSSDSGGWVSLGAEYYFAPGFSLGCEGGIRYAKAKSKAYGYEIKINDYTSFAAILMSFYI